MRCEAIGFGFIVKDNSVIENIVYKSFDVFG
jgi:hypothetical protein